MSAPLERTATPGIYRRGNRYVVVYRDPSGGQRKRFARTLAEARELKATLTADVRRGEFRMLSTVSFAEYASEWIESYKGRTRRGFRETTRSDYRKALERWAIPFFGKRRLAEIQPRDVKRFAAHVEASGLSSATVRNICAPVKALLGDALDEGLIRSNPAAGIRLTNGHDPEEAGPRALSEEELRRLLGEIPDRWRLFFEFLSQTGLRIGEAVALQWQDVDFARRRVAVRRRIYRGTVAPPKSRYGRRDVPISRSMAQALAARWNETRPAPTEPVFPSERGTPLSGSNVMGRVLKPAARRAGLGWVGFHTFRHTAASRLFERGLNVKQVQAWLGHHKASFTLDTYVHLLSDELPESPFEEEPEPVEPEPVEEGSVFEDRPAADGDHDHPRGATERAT